MADESIWYHYGRRKRYPVLATEQKETAQTVSQSDGKGQYAE